MSESDFFAIGNYQGGNQQWGYMYGFRLYEGTHTPAELPQLMSRHEPMVSMDVVDGEIVFGGTASYTGVIQGAPSIVAGPTNEMDAILFSGDIDQALLGSEGIETDASWTVDCYFKTPIPQTGAWHTLTRGHGGDHQVIIHPDQISLGSYDNTHGAGFSDTGYDITVLLDGWHRLTVAAGEGSAHFYVDGAEVGSHSVVSETDFYSIGNHWGNTQQWGYVYGVRIYDGMHSPSDLQEPGTYTQTSYQPPVLLVTIDVQNEEIVFGGTANYDGVVLGSPTIVAGPRGASDAILFSAGGDMLQLGEGIDTDASWTVDCYFKTPIDQTGAWHTLARGAGGDHQIIINPDQASLGSYDNAGGSGFTDTGFDITSLSDGWHRLTVAAGDGSAHFYVDGAEVGSHSVVSESDFFAIGNYQGGNQQWGYMYGFRLYDGTHRPSALPASMIVPDPMVSIDVEGGQVVFGGTASYDGVVAGNPEVVAGPSGAMDALLFSAGGDMLQLTVGESGIDTDASWTVDCYFKTPIPQTDSWHTLTRGAGGDHQIIINPDQASLGSYDNVGGAGFTDTGFDITSLSDGWHRLTVAAGEGTAEFFVDSRSVGGHSAVSESDFFAVGNHLGAGNQQWGYMYGLRIYDGPHRPEELPELWVPQVLMVAVDVVGEEIVFGGAASYDGVVVGGPTIVEGPTGAMDAVLFSGATDQLQLGHEIGVDTDASWTVDCYFKTPIPQTDSWHTLTRGAGGDHQIIINPDQASLGSYDNVGGAGFTDTGFDITSLSDGWHRLTVAAGQGAATFYVDGESVGSHSAVSESDFFAVGNYQGNGQQWGYLNSFRIYDGTIPPSMLPPSVLGGHVLDQLDGVSVYGGPGVYDRGNEAGFNSIIDMNHSPDQWVHSPGGGPCECTPESALYITVDLGRPILITGVTIWHYYGDDRAYCAQKVALSLTGQFLREEHVVYDTGSEYGPPESPDGNSITFPGYTARYVRHWSAGSTTDTNVHFIEVDVYGVPASVAPGGGGH
eukprot:SAG22_NODE_967_length_6262_cov_20.374980_1_plen_1008_part_00